MAETDGQVEIGVKINTDKVDPQMQKLQQKLARQNEALARQSLIVERLTAQYEALYEKAKQTAKPNIESDKILVEINKLEDRYKKLQNELSQAKLEPEIDQSKIDEILRNLEVVDKKLIDLRRKHQEVQFSPDMQNKLKLLGQQIDIAIQKENRLTNEVKETNNEIEKLSKKKIDGLKAIIDKIKNSFANLGNKIKETQSNILNYAKNGIDNAFSSVSNTLGGLSKRILSLGASAFVFNVISSGFHKMADGIRNVIAHDNQLSGSLAQVRANLSTAFYPIYQAILPAIQSLGRALSWVTGQIASFMAMLTGTSVKANQQGAKSLVAQTSGISDQTKQLGKQAKGYDKVAKSAKKAKGQLASFDKIEVLKQKKSGKTPKTNDSGGSIGKNIGGGISDIFQGFQNNTPQLLDSIAQAFERFKKPFENMDLSRLNTSLSNLWEILQRFAGKIGEGLWWFYENVLAPLAVWTISEVLPRFLTILANILEFLEPILDQVGEDFKWLWDNFLKPVAEWTGSLITQFLNNLANVIKDLGDKIKENKPLLEFISAFLIGLGTAGVVMGLIKLGMALWGVVSATWAWTVALLANPITWIVVGVAALVAGLILLAKHWDKTGKSTSKAQEILEKCGKSIKSAIEIIGKIFKDVFDEIVKIWNENIKPMLDRMKEKFVDVFNKHIAPALGKFAKAFTGIINKIMILVGKLWDFIKPFVNWIVEMIADTLTTTISDIFNIVSDVVGGICEFLSNLWDIADKCLGFIVNLLNGDWNKAWESAGKVVDAMKETVKSAVKTVGSAIKGMIEMLIGGINVAIRALNKIHIDLPDWLGGHHFGLNIPEISKDWTNKIPHLAKGAVLEGGHPFLAMLNDQPRGQMNIETPLSTMIEAFKQANRQSNPNIVVEASGDFAPFIRMLNFKLKEEDARIGQSFISGDVWI